jgi:type VI protein secretion system component VasF
VVLIGGWQVPMWVSAVAIVITAYLAYEGFRISQSKQIR